MNLHIATRQIDNNLRHGLQINSIAGTEHEGCLKDRK